MHIANLEFWDNPTSFYPRIKNIFYKLKIKTKRKLQFRFIRGLLILINFTVKKSNKIMPITFGGSHFFLISLSTESGV